MIATKAGLERPGPGQWVPNGDPEYLKSECEGSLRRLRLDCIPLFQLHRIDRNVPLEEQIGALIELRDEGKIRFIGLSEVSVSQYRMASSQAFARGMLRAITAASCPSARNQRASGLTPTSRNKIDSGTPVQLLVLVSPSTCCGVHSRLISR